MASNILFLDIPNFNPKYSNQTKYSYEGKGKENLKNLLTETSKGYCMYCYSRILVDRKNYGALEHSIEKFNSDKLKNCLSNISIACPKCNSSFKKIGERLRALTVQEVSEFESELECSVTCIKTCSRYKALKSLYAKKDSGEIILQPFGISNSNTGIEYKIQYDVIGQKFIPSTLYDYTEEDKRFIKKHIDRFNLNDSKYRTKEFLKFIEDVLEYNVIPKKGRYNNFIVDIFIDSLNELQLEKKIKLCKFIYTNLLLNNKN